MQNTLGVNMTYLKQSLRVIDAVTDAMDKHRAERLATAKDGERLALGTKERDEQEDYFDRMDEAYARARGERGTDAEEDLK